MPNFISGRDRVFVIEHLSAAFVSLLKAQEVLGYDNTLDAAMLAVHEQLDLHLKEAP